MVEPKTKPTSASVEDILNNVFKELSGDQPQMWEPGIAGFGKYINN